MPPLPQTEIVVTHDGGKSIMTIDGVEVSPARVSVYLVSRFGERHRLEINGVEPLYPTTVVVDGVMLCHVPGVLSPDWTPEPQSVALSMIELP